MMDLLNAFRRTRRLFDDPTKGIEYNQLVPNRNVSKYIYTADIARNPQIVSEGLQFVDVQAEARFINSQRDLVDSKVRRVKGRST